ncbi:hypothetical protein E4U55_005971 [Claviceps digitariae]|nr:hypothetical protein E4U55_005971 [Claviceps digitariae]
MTLLLSVALFVVSSQYLVSMNDGSWEGAKEPELRRGQQGSRQVRSWDSGRSELCGSDQRHLPFLGPLQRTLQLQPPRVSV